MSTRRRTRYAAVFAALALAATAGCGGGDDDNGGGGGGGSDSDLDLPDLDGTSLEVAAVWTGAEQKTFQKVIDMFQDETGAKVSFTSTGDDIATVLGTKVKGGDAPDVAILPQPGLLAQFAESGDIKPLSDDAVSAVDDNFASIWKELGSHDGTPYGVWLDASSKSTVWYRTQAFDDAGVSEPKTWEDFLAAGTTLSDSGVPVPISIAGADGWTLTDWFENLYLRIGGAEKYDQLSTHEIPWTDSSVVETLKTLGELFSDETLIGDPGAALQTDFPTSVTNVFSADAKSAIVFEGSFVPSAITDDSFTPGDTAKWFPFPSVDDSPEAVVGGGDVAVAFSEDEGAQAFVQFLASPEAAAEMVSTGSFTSANKNLDPGAYPDDNSKAVGQSIVDAGDNVRFDMSDLAPSQFGATVGSGEWKILQDFLRDPSDPEGTAKALEAAAAKAFG